MERRGIVGRNDRSDFPSASIFLLTQQCRLCCSHKSGYNIIGIVGQKSLLGGREVPTYRSFQQFLGENKETLHCIIQTELYSDENKNSELLSYAQENHVSYRFVPAKQWSVRGQPRSGIIPIYPSRRHGTSDGIIWLGPNRKTPV